MEEDHPEDPDDEMAWETIVDAPGSPTDVADEELTFTARDTFGSRYNTTAPVRVLS